MLDGLAHMLVTLGDGGALSSGIARAAAGADLIKLVPAITLGATAMCGVFAAMKVKSKLPAWFSVASLAACFGVVLAVFLGHDGTPRVAHAFDWINFSWTISENRASVTHDLVSNFAFYVDSLTLLWMLFVTGLAALIALYASEYMSHDVGAGYCRFFAAFNLFVFSMSCLVMGDNLLLTFLGWEGVGLCSYLLIGYYYTKDSAVAAGKKAFIMNRIGDLGFVLGLMSTYVAFGTLEYDRLFDLIGRGVDGAGQPITGTWVVQVIPFLFAIGAFGKSAQIFFYVWLPDAMEGPTPVSALIHAATMVTAGVFLIARLYPLFAADDAKLALSFVAWSGALTALWAATIEMAIFDIKRVMGYSTISQLGFMFAGLGLLTPTGAAYHTFTHAFFKATLFLGVGAVMHGFGGQLDLRRLSGVAWMRGFGLVGVAMLIGSINLSGVPGTAGFFSKDMILAQGFTTPGTTIWGAQAVGWILLVTAGMTAYYTFRTYFRVYVGPKEFTPGEDAHAHDDHHGHGHKEDFDPTTAEFDPHPPGAPMKVAIGLGMALTLLAAIPYFMGGHAARGEHAAPGGWVGGMVAHSSAAYNTPHEGFSFLGLTSHAAMYFISAGVGAVGLLIAAYLHGPKGWQGLWIGNRTEAATSRADALVPLLGRVVTFARNKWYVDEIYDFLIVKPLWVLSHVLYFIDQWVVDGLVNLFGAAPGMTGKAIRPTQNGELHGYAAWMAGGLAVVLLVVILVAT
ncbi:MAG: NADH-quinone oxidoreductase subunit L [Phycisphaerae bacterium]|nr:MAG: NADH-quinone oxidoreductase subunit L [Phycisphaerae bacterium]